MATYALWAYIGFALALALLQLASVRFSKAFSSLPSETLRTINLSIYASSMGAMVVCAVLVSLWIYAAHSHLRSITKSELQFTPGWAVGWYFVPMAHLFKPFFAMQELWKFSQITRQSQNRTDLLIEIWWICWIVGGVASYISSSATVTDALTGSIFFAMEIFGTAAEIVAAFCLIRIIAAVTQAQGSRAEINAAFA